LFARRLGAMTTYIDSLKRLLFFKLAVIYLRYLIGFAFVFASIIKIKGDRFTSISPSEPIGYFFEALYQSGFYWNFLGWSQFIAGALMMTQRFATVGTLMFLPIILNVFMITHAIDFGMGTPVITTLMLLGTLFLLAWDYQKWTILFKRDHSIHVDLTGKPKDNFMHHPVWTVAGVIFVLMATIPWLFDFHQLFIWAIAMLSVGAGAFVIVLYNVRRGEGPVKREHPGISG